LEGIISLDLIQDFKSAVIKNVFSSALEKDARCLCLLGTADLAASESFHSLLKEAPIPVFGGLFPRIIHDYQLIESGLIVIGLADEPKLIIVDQLTDGEEQLHNSLSQQNLECFQSFEQKSDPSKTRSHSNFCSMMIFTDGGPGGAQNLIENIHELANPKLDVIGAVTGADDLGNVPTVITPYGLMKDALVMAIMPSRIFFAHDHGYEILGGPYLVTRSQGNVINSINYASAMDIYFALLKELTDEKPSIKNLHELSVRYPLGIKTIEDKILVRSPIGHHDGDLIIVGEINEYSMVYLLRAREDIMIGASANAAAQASKAWRKAKIKQKPYSLLFDCVSRFEHLNGHYANELHKVRDNSGPIRHNFGALTLGEIVNSEQGSLTLLNKTTLVGLITEQTP
jgi:hypothetical protein